MHRIRLIHWNRAEAEERAEALRAAGHEVISSAFGPGSLRELREYRPSAVVIDLTRLPGPRIIARRCHPEQGRVCVRGEGPRELR